MKKINLLTAFIFFITANIISQTLNPLGFWPHHTGDVWQYRDAVNNEIMFTRYLDSIYIDTTNKDAYLYYRPVGNGTIVKIDTLGNLYYMHVIPEYPRYKLYADSGDTWVAGVTEDDTVSVTVTDIYEGNVFGEWTTIKVFTFERITSYLPDPFWLGDDYLANGFGWIYSFGEGGTAPYLAGAIIDSVLYGHVVSVEPTEPVPDEFIIFQNYPNPFNPLTTIEFELPAEAYGSINIYSILGENISTLFTGQLRSGTHKYVWDASGFSSGIYLCVLNVNGKTRTIKMLLTK
jgi:hypothetical protein